MQNVNLLYGNTLGTASAIYGELVELTFDKVNIENCTSNREKGLGNIYLIGKLNTYSNFTDFNCTGNVAMTGACLFAKDIAINC